MQKYPVISPPIQTLQEGVQNLKFPDITPQQFCFAIVGKPGSGKSHLVKELIMNKDLYFKKFDKIIFVTPSAYQELQLDSDNSMDCLSPIWLQEKLQEYQKTIKNLNNILIILDDVVSELSKLTRDKFINQLFFNRRHIIPDCCISLLITTQKYNVIPARFRSCLTGVMLFQVNKQDWQIVLNELIFIDLNLFRQIYEQVFKQPYSFLYILLQPYKLHCNFKPISY